MDARQTGLDGRRGELKAVRVVSCEELENLGVGDGVRERPKNKAVAADRPLPLVGWPGC